MSDQRYNMRGVSASKEDVHNAIKNVDKGLYPKAFCKIIPDILGGDEEYCNIMHADGAGTKSSLAYIYWKETGDITKILEEIHKEPELSYDKEALQERMEEEESILFRNPSYESAIIGITTDGRAVYDYYRMIEELSKEDDIDYGEAEDFILYNTVGSLRPAEEKFPIIMYKREDII